MNYTEETVWTTHEGRRLKLKNLPDTHLANLIQFTQEQNRNIGSTSPYYDVKLIRLLKQIAKKRGLKKEFLERSQIPYKNKTSKWEIFDFVKQRFIQLQK